MQIEKIKPTFKESFAKCGSSIDYTMNIPEQLYNDNYLHYTEPFVQRIPKIFHYVWLGQPMPTKFQDLIDIWKEKHPTWEFKLWNETTVESFGLHNKALYSAMKNPSAKSDVVRHEVLHRFGGIYSDTDFLCNKPLDDLLYLNYFTGYQPVVNGITTCEHILPGIIGSCIGNGMCKNIIDAMSKIESTPHTIGEIMTTGPILYANEILRELDPELTVLFPPSYFYNFWGGDRMKIRNTPVKDLPSQLKYCTFPESYATHLYYCSWQ
jgi:mannosyltransferase OCH1-like enzyme